jgi:formylglycine-generating enzyme required for sulfatase activity
MASCRTQPAGSLPVLCLVVGAVAAVAAEPNPRVVTARDPKLDREFEYLDFDLGAGVELRLVKVPARGKTFTIGSTREEQDRVVERYHAGKRPATLDFEEPATITLTDDFYIGQFEVCRAQFRRFVTETGHVTDGERAEGGYGYNEETLKGEGRDRKYTWQNTGISTAGEQHPVTNVSRDDARAFCAWLRKKCDGTVAIREVRLPGEAEWEFACRAGTTTRFCTGDDDESLARVANVADAAWREKLGGPNAVAIAASDGHVFAAPVGQFAPNAFGIYDMHGNVWEWTDDFYGRYAALPKTRNAYQDVSQGETRPVLRGGSWGFPPVASRSAHRWLVGAGPSRYGAAGFRIVVVPPAAGGQTGRAGPASAADPGQ